MNMKLTGGLVALVAALYGLVGPAAAAETLTLDLAGVVIDCGERSYTVESGTLHVAVHSTERVLTVATPYRHVVVTDPDGNTYSLRGTQRFGESAPGALTYTGMLSIIGRGQGVVDTSRVVFHMSPNGHEVDIDFGSCYPAP